MVSLTDRAGQTAAHPARAGLGLPAADGLVALGLGMLALLLQLPFRTRMLYAWDSILYALALDDFDAVAHQPQPPGYLFYVLGARAVRAVTGLPANDAYVAVGALAAAATVGLVCLSGAALFGRRVGVVAAALAATSVAFSLYAGLAYPYTTLAAGSALLGWLFWQVRLGHLPAWTAGLAFGVVTGFRQDLLVLLGPLFVASVGPRPFGRLVGASLAVAAAGLLWFVPSALASGGVAAYLGALVGQTARVERDTSAAADGLAGVLLNARFLARYAMNTLYLALVPLGVWVLASQTPGARRDPRRRHLLLWAAPAVLVYTLLHLGEIGYVFSFMPPIWLAAGAGLALMADAVAHRLRRPGWRLALLTALTAVPVAFSLWWSHASDRPLSRHWLACKDGALAEAVARVADYPPATTLLVASGYYQHARYYLPAYTTWLHDPFQAAELRRTVPPGVTHLLVFDILPPDGPTVHSAAQPLALGCGYRLPTYAVAAGDTIVVRAAGVEVLR